MTKIDCMEKKLISVHAVTVHIYTIAIILLLLLLGILGLKYLHLKLAVQNYTQSTIWMNSQDKPTGQISDYGLIIANSVNSVPQTSLEGYISSLSKQLNRDVVVLDKNEKIMADTLPSNVGKLYSYDLNNEVKMTIEDGASRRFEEKSADYPNGIMQVVVPIKNSSGQTTGAVLVSDSTIK